MVKDIVGLLQLAVYTEYEKCSEIAATKPLMVLRALPALS